MNNLAVIYESSDQYADAVDALRPGPRVGAAVGDRVWEEIFLHGPISALVLLGRWDEALARGGSSEAAAGTHRWLC